MSEEAEKAWVAKIRAGDEDAAREFFRALYPQVLRIVRNHRSVRHSEEDLCQMIFLKAFHKIDQYSGRMPVSHWISRIAVNTCLNERKKDAIRPELLETDLHERSPDFLTQWADTSLAPAQSARSAHDLVKILLDRLKPADRIVMAMLHLEGYSVAETSSRTGFSQAVVKIRAFRARQKLNREFSHLVKENLP